MRVLILVLSSHIPPYDRLYEAQRRTWDSATVEGVETQYYFCESWDTYGPLKTALDTALRLPWVHLFRTNSSSYIDKYLLREYAATMPSTGCYAGGEGHCRGYRYASGCGCLMSRDAVLAVYRALDGPLDMPGEIEDVFMGRAITSAGISVTPAVPARPGTTGTQRFDYWSGDYNGPLPDTYHYRCAGSRDGARLDFESFERIHAMKCALRPQFYTV